MRLTLSIERDENPPSTLQVSNRRQKKPCVVPEMTDAHIALVAQYAPDTLPARPGSRAARVIVVNVPVVSRDYLPMANGASVLLQQYAINIFDSESVSGLEMLRSPVAGSSPLPAILFNALLNSIRICNVSRSIKLLVAALTGRRSSITCSFIEPKSIQCEHLTALAASLGFVSHVSQQIRRNQPSQYFYGRETAIAECMP